MLISLQVRHFAVVDAAEIAFGPGLTVVSGETGAGKSLLVDALMLLAGARADSSMVRTGSDRAELNAEFDVGKLPAALRWLQQEAFDEENHCQLRRVIRAEGSSKAWINGRPATTRQMAELAAHLLEIHGQHEHQALLSRTHQLALLDAYANHGALLDRVRQAAQQWRETVNRIRALSGGADRDQRLQLLRHELDTLQKWVLSADQVEALAISHKRLANAGRLAEGSAGVLELLDGDSDFALLRALGRAHGELVKLTAIDPKLQPLLELFDQAHIALSEAADGLGRYAQDVDLDPQRYNEADNQLRHLHELSRRYRVPANALHDTLSEAQRALAELEDAGEALKKLTTQQDQLLVEYTDSAIQLSASRRLAALQLGQETSTLMGEMGMAGGVLKIELEPTGPQEPDQQGQERCDLLVSANPGQALRPLRKVASGGELARISLAIEVATLGNDPAGSMIFDEVDSGIGGAVAEVVGQKLRALGGQRQVLCVTHLPQVAAQGHAHLRVSKHMDGESTHTRIETLDDRSRCDELARMLGGVEITRETRAHARQMLGRAQAAQEA